MKNYIKKILHRISCDSKAQTRILTMAEDSDADDGDDDGYRYGNKMSPVLVMLIRQFRVYALNFHPDLITYINWI